MAKAVNKDAEWEAALQQLRARVMDWPAVVETQTYGNPTFKVGRKTFAVPDNYRGEGCVWVRCAAERRGQILEAPGFFPSPYDPKQLAVCRSLKDLNWEAFTPLLAKSYEDSQEAVVERRLHR